MKNKINNFLAIFCLILTVLACGDEKPDDIEQSKPAEITDERCQKDGEKNGEDEVDCVIVDNKEPNNSPNKPDTPNTVGIELLHQYLPKKCYKSISSSGSVSFEHWTDEHSLNDRNFTLTYTIDSSKFSYSGSVINYTTGFFLADYEKATEIIYTGRQGSLSGYRFWYYDPDDGHRVDWIFSENTQPAPKSGYYEFETYCPDLLLDTFRNPAWSLKMVELDGKNVLYAETFKSGLGRQWWFNLKPFYKVKEINTASSEGHREVATWIYKDVKITE